MAFYAATLPMSPTEQAPHAAPLLQVRQLEIALPTRRGLVRAVRGLDLTLNAGQTLGLIGESGCGKSLTALALMGLLPAGAQVGGSIRLAGQELLGLPDAHWCRLRGNRLAMVFQEPMTALNPLHRIGHQVAEPLRLHQGLSARQARQEVVALLERVGITQAASRLDAYPHQFSGGQRQRITLAMALACGPSLLIADEPTTALDVTLQRQILDLIAELVAERGMALLLISHDLSVIAHATTQTVVMYGGMAMESGTTEAVLGAVAPAQGGVAQGTARRGSRPHSHPYTQGLLAARPRLGGAGQHGQRLATIAGNVPALADLPPGCPFAGRCPHTLAQCHQQPPPAVPLDESGGVVPPSMPHLARCWSLLPIMGRADDDS